MIDGLSEKKNFDIIDIGANIGIYSIYAGLNPNLNIYAFEPASNNFNLIKLNRGYQMAIIISRNTWI